MPQGIAGLIDGPIGRGVSILRCGKAIVLFRQTLQSTAYLNSRFIICLLG